jgi:hypothetical protein
MVSTVTPAVLRTLADSNLSATLSAMAVAALIVVLVGRELAVSAGGRLQRLGRDLPLVAAPLLFAFIDIVLGRVLIIR